MQSIIIDNIIQNMPIGALAINPQGEIIIANESVAHILGYPLETIMANGWGALFLENQANDAFNQVLLDVIWQEPLNLHRQVSYTRPNGDVIQLSITSSFLREFQELVGIVILFDDITEIHNLHVKEKEWLEEKNRLHQEKAEGLFRLSLAVAHQLRNPTAAIGGLAKLIQKKTANESVVNDYSQQIIKCAKRLEDIVKGVENYIAIPPIKPCYFQAQQIFNKMQPYVAQLADSLSHKINWLCQTQSLKIFADPELLTCAIWEILKNAVENITVHGNLEISCFPEQNHQIIRISDNACGIAPENMPFIFDPFFTTKVLGVGMGLCIAQKIIHDHGGNLVIESRPRGGTTVQIHLPYH
jgi:PAS domain S-box-containing protein